MANGAVTLNPQMKTAIMNLLRTGLAQTNTQVTDEQLSVIIDETFPLMLNRATEIFKRKYAITEPKNLDNDELPKVFTKLSADSKKALRNSFTKLLQQALLHPNIEVRNDVRAAIGIVVEEREPPTP